MEKSHAEVIKSLSALSTHSEVYHLQDHEDPRYAESWTRFYNRYHSAITKYILKKAQWSKMRENDALEIAQLACVKGWKWNFKAWLLFRKSDFKKPSQLISKLRDASINRDNVSLYLKGKLSEHFQQRINAYDGGEVVSDFLKTLIAEFNRLLEMELYQKEVFENIMASKKNKKSVKSNELKYGELRRFNRLLFVESYPDEIKQNYRFRDILRRTVLNTLCDYFTELNHKEHPIFLEVTYTPDNEWEPLCDVDTDLDSCLEKVAIKKVKEEIIQHYTPEEQVVITYIWNHNGDWPSAKELGALINTTKVDRQWEPSKIQQNARKWKERHPTLWDDFKNRFKQAYDKEINTF